MKKYLLVIALTSLLPMTIVRAELYFELTIDSDNPWSLIGSGQHTYCGENAHGFKLEALGFEGEYDFELHFLNPTTDEYEKIRRTFDISEPLHVQLNEGNLSRIDCQYLISSIDSIPDIGRIEWVFYINIDDSIRNAIQDSLSLLVSYPSITAADWIHDRYSSFKSTPFGIELPAGCIECEYNGASYTHLFFDQYGNSLCSVVPQGIPGRQYVVHIVYLRSTDSEPMDYLVNQTAGDYIDSYVLRNTGNLDSVVATLTGSSDQNGSRSPQYYWTESVTCLNTSTTDIQIEISGIVYQQGLESIDNSVLIASRGIHMTPVYHGSLDLGFVNSTLSDPDYSLIMQSESTGVVRISGDGNRGLFTAMATLYSSPVAWIQSLAGTDIPSYKLHGRSFLDDHEWYQRFYPTIGLEVSSSALESFFGGLSFEFARGGNLFAGIHYGKVSRMNLPEGFIEGQTQMTEEEFNLRLDEEWNIGFTYGLSLDIGILTKLFSSLSL